MPVCSTTYVLVNTMHHWHKAIDDGQSVQVVFVDFNKAFEHVDHNVLMARLVQFGLPDTITCWMF